MTKEMLTPLQHIGIRRPRPGFLGECAFSEKWVERMNRTRKDWDQNTIEAIDQVLRNFSGQITQRIASVIAGTVAWLGTNCGRSMLHDAEKLRASRAAGRGHEYLMAWASENARQRGINSGMRVIESIVVAEADSTDFGPLNFAPLGPVTFHDLEAVDCLMMWLADVEGQRFLSEALAEVEVRAAAMRHREAIEHAARVRSAENIA